MVELGELQENQNSQQRDSPELTDLLQNAIMVDH